ncbi:MAG: hypothetical protein ACI4D6_09755 [Chordicoccus sp.]
MQAIMETIFEILYLSFAITAGLAMLQQSKKDHKSAIRLGKRLRRTEKAVEQSVAKKAAASAAKATASDGTEEHTESDETPAAVPQTALSKVSENTRIVEEALNAAQTDGASEGSEADVITPADEAQTTASTAPASENAEHKKPSKVYTAAELKKKALFRSRRASLLKKAGIMTLVLGFGDCFHLIPRMYALWTTGLAKNAALLGGGKLITSLTMTIFYVILYYVWRDRYRIADRNTLTFTVLALAAVRIVLCLLPQNKWLSANPPLLFGVLRNIPFILLGALILILFRQAVRENHDKKLQHLPLAIGISFVCYIPVVLLAGIFPVVGMLMIPKTIAYMWIIAMFLNLFM